MNLYLSSYEYADFSKPRRILNFEKNKIEGRNILRIVIDSPLQGQKYGLEDDQIKVLYLVNRFDEKSFEDFVKFPIDVHVFIPKRKKNDKVSSFSELQMKASPILVAIKNREKSLTLIEEYEKDKIY